MTVQLSRDEARRLVIRAQLLDADRPGDLVEVAEQLGSIKIDPTATIAPSEHTIAWTRIGSTYDPGSLAKASEGDRQLFEFDGEFHHISLLPLLQASMRQWPRHQGWKDWLAANTRFEKDVLARLRAEGPLLAADIPDTAQVAISSDHGWYGPNQVPRMLESLMRRGSVAVVGREGRQRKWDIAERVYPQDVPQYTAEEAAELLAARRLRGAGLARQKSRWSGAGMAGVEASVEGSSWRYRADPDALASLSDDPGGRIAILNPYDGMLYDRPRLREVFGFDYVLEQFKPKHERRFGQFAHPILSGDQFIGQLDAAVDRKTEVLRVRAIHETTPFEPEEHEMVMMELTDLAQWLGVELRFGDED